MTCTKRIHDQRYIHLLVWFSYELDTARKRLGTDMEVIHREINFRGFVVSSAMSFSLILYKMIRVTQYYNWDYQRRTLHQCDFLHAWVLKFLYTKALIFNAALFGEGGSKAEINIKCVHSGESQPNRISVFRGKDTRVPVSFSLSLSPLPTPRRLSTKTDHSGSTVLNFQLPEKWENWVVLLKLSCHWYFAMPTCFNFLCVSIIKSLNKSNVRKGRVWLSLWLQARDQQCGKAELVRSHPQSGSESNVCTQANAQLVFPMLYHSPGPPAKGMVLLAVLAESFWIASP